jgi:hypothetical protein
MGINFISAQISKTPYLAYITQKHRSNNEEQPSLLVHSPPGSMSEVTPQEVYPEPPSKRRNDIAIELISGSVGGAAQVLSGQAGLSGLSF